MTDQEVRDFLRDQSQLSLTESYRYLLTLPLEERDQLAEVVMADKDHQAQREGDAFDISDWMLDSSPIRVALMEWSVGATSGFEQAAEDARGKAAGK